MKKIIASATIATLVATCSIWVVTARGQSEGSSPQASSTAHKVAVVDMGHIFKNYKKFEVLRDDLKTSMAKTQQEVQQKVQQMQSLQQQMQSLKEDSPDYQQREEQLLRLKSDFQTYQQMAKKDLLRKESEVYRTIYLEVADWVRRYAEHYGYTLVLRFNRNALEQADNPQEVLQSLNQQVIYHRDAVDITDEILGYLNREYAKGNGADAQQQTGQRPTGTRQR